MSKEGRALVVMVRIEVKGTASNKQNKTKAQVCVIRRGSYHNNGRLWAAVGPDS